MSKFRLSGSRALLLLALAASSVFFNMLFIWQSYERARVAAVLGADTLLLADGRRITLAGVDAPAPGECEEKAAAMLRALALGKHVRLKHLAWGEGGDVRAIVIVEDFPTWMAYLRARAQGLPLDRDPLPNRALLASGLAAYAAPVPGEYQHALRAASDAAREGGLGIYSDSCGGTD